MFAYLCLNSITSMATQYDFITNPGTTTTKTAVKLPGGKLALIAGIGIVGVIILLIVMNLFFGGNPGRESLLKVVQSQHELVRITTLPVASETNQDTKNIVMNVQASLISAQTRTTSAIEERGISFKEKEIKLVEDTKTDAALETAKTAGMLDETVRNTLKTQLTTYSTALSTAYDDVQSDSIKETLTKLFSEASLLLKSLS